MNLLIMITMKHHHIETYKLLGIPEFWYDDLKNSCISEDIKSYDEPILKKYLEDITLEFDDNPPVPFDYLDFF
jgi:hypothetical protein